jgi:hypothetical protein
MQNDNLFKRWIGAGLVIVSTIGLWQLNQWPPPPFTVKGGFAHQIINTNDNSTLLYNLYGTTINKNVEFYKPYKESSLNWTLFQLDLFGFWTHMRK